MTREQFTKVIDELQNLQQEDADILRMVCKAFLNYVEDAEVDRDGEGDTSRPDCPECFWTHDSGHHSNCSIGRALAKAHEVLKSKP
jgi:hypothetical protein